MDARIETLGDTALLLHVGDGMDRQASARVHALTRAVREADPDGLDDIVPAYASVLLRHHLTTTKATDALHQQIRELIAGLPDQADTATGHLHRIEVCYSGDYGSDLAELASACGMSADEVVKRHCAPEYQVAMTGFAPGFPYLIGLDPALATPRRDTPRTRVPAGSVGIAGPQTGIYPSELPGGWQLIGRTPLRLLDADHADQPCLLEPGDRVRFESIDASQFKHRDPSC
ncbi:MAG TPA: 5-oxoprolinase subunit PxpB [Oleiagrimonas sp.]|nr:5-oxoprolinase subunit PxpB [Oleiagrimonas sp.]